MSFTDHPTVIIVQPVFLVQTAAAATDQSSRQLFQGVKKGTYRGKNLECRFIINCLREHFGDDLSFDDLPNGHFAVYNLTPAQEVELYAINKDSHEFPLPYGRCFLTFLPVENCLVRTKTTYDPVGVL
jgi:hypothetical protein